MTAATSNK